MNAMEGRTMIESMLTLWASAADEKFDPERLSVEMGIAATKGWKKNDPFSVGSGVRKQGGWRYSSGRQIYSPEGGTDFFSQLSIIKMFLSTHKTQIISACKNHSLTPELSCVMHVVGEDRPGLGYDKDLVVLLGEVGAEIDVDLYFYPEPPDSHGDETSLKSM
jgi:hypothetical protein